MTSEELGPSTDTVLFTDLVGFTEYNDVFGDAAAVAALDTQLAIACHALTGDSRLVKELGDGLMFWFPHPKAALATATAILGAIDSVREHDGFPLGIRMGMHAGAVTARGDDVVGHTVNVASRIVDLAGPGELVVSDSVVAALEPTAATFQPVGPARVKGVQQPVWLHRLAG
ncbi:MAG TPA: adenylate/guanylate cyclase domain-containing protein [Ilumatobacteraceae bacterium]|nr:adenylate/guanylate cyclase domain-containing protein [Ilumatobacteraceae bacterium]